MLAQGNAFLTLELARSVVAGVAATRAPTARDAITARFLELDDSTLGGPAPARALRRRALPRKRGSADRRRGGGRLRTARRRAGGGRTRGGRWQLPLPARPGASGAGRAGPTARPPGRITATAAERAGGGRRRRPPVIARHWIDGDRPDEAVDWLIDGGHQRRSRSARTPTPCAELDPLLEHEPGHREALRLRAEALDALGDARRARGVCRSGRGRRGCRRPRTCGPSGRWPTIKQGDAPGGAARSSRASSRVSVEGTAGAGAGLQRRGGAGLRRSRRSALRVPPKRAGLALRIRRRAGARRWPRGPRPPPRTPAATCATASRPTCARPQALPELAISVFDGQLCMTPAAALRRAALRRRDRVRRTHSRPRPSSSAPRAGTAFAVTRPRRGEAAGRAPGRRRTPTSRAARRLHRDIAAATGEAFSLQRRAEVALHRGDHGRR